MTDTPDPWGPYRATIEDHLDTCADYLSRLCCSLAGEIAPDRQYLADKAYQLHIAAHRMVRIVHDVDGWLGECGVALEHDDTDGTRFTAECPCPPSRGSPRRLPLRPFGRHITHDLRDLADAVERLGQHFGWTSPAVDRGLTGAPGTIANSHDAPADLAASLDTIRHRTTRLAADVRAVAASSSEPHPAVGSATTRPACPPTHRPRWSCDTGGLRPSARPIATRLGSTGTRVGAGSECSRRDLTDAPRGVPKTLAFASRIE